jgi:hypothetical protein
MNGGRSRTDKEALVRLSDILAEDVLGASDTEIVAEAVERGRDPAEDARAGRTLFERVALDVAKAKMAEAKAAVAATRGSRRAQPQLSPDEARQTFEQIVAANDAELSRKLTMAARKGEGQSERDIAGIVEDLADLGALNGDGSKGD